MLHVKLHKSKIEASVGVNILILVPLNDNFQRNEVYGRGASASINIPSTPFSIGFSTDSRPTDGENSILKSYLVIKVGYGIGVGGSYTPNSDTQNFDWIPDITQSFFHWK
jgi:hypothetical protein